MNSNKWLYGDSWERFSIESSEVWQEQYTLSKVTIADITNNIPDFMREADFLYCDPPWNTGNMRSFYTKAGLQTNNDFSIFSNVLFSWISNAMPKICYLEIGLRSANDFKSRLHALYPSIQEWKIVYYNKYPTMLLRGGLVAINYDFSRLDDTKTPGMAMDIEDFSCAADLCMGRGLTAIAAFARQKRFVGTELNKRRLAVTLDRVAKMGGIWNRV